MPLTSRLSPDWKLETTRTRISLNFNGPSVCLAPCCTFNFATANQRPRRRLSSSQNLTFCTLESALSSLLFHDIVTRLHVDHHSPCLNPRHSRGRGLHSISPASSWIRQPHSQWPISRRKSVIPAKALVIPSPVPSFPLSMLRPRSQSLQRLRCIQPHMS